MKLVVTFILVISARFTLIYCSEGDRSLLYRECIVNCNLHNCSKGGVYFLNETIFQQDIWCYALQWYCRDECSYICMWQTVEEYEKTEQTPKFHGKWPFIRFLGIQEPASAFSSLLNLAANMYMYRKIRQEFPMRTSPLVMFWHVFAFICMNAWIWSTIFHTRDKPFTEFMDYASALSMVMALFIAAVVRLFYRRRELTGVILVVPLFYFVTHVHYLYDGRIDYDYNMKINVFFGVCGSLLWLAWSVQQLVGGRTYTRRMILFTLGSGAALSLELFDFPPLWRTWDAHALWHLSTAPLPLLFYRFVLDDLRFLQSGHYEKLDAKRTA